MFTFMLIKQELSIRSDPDSIYSCSVECESAFDGIDGWGTSDSKAKLATDLIHACDSERRKNSYLGLVQQERSPYYNLVKLFYRKDFYICSASQCPPVKQIMSRMECTDIKLTKYEHVYTFVNEKIMHIFKTSDFTYAYKAVSS